jgi:arylsulfatase A-like enzyme
VAWALTAGRAINAIFFLFTSVYCLLTYSPFAYEQFIQPHVIAWLANFVLLYADFYWLVLCVTALTLVPYLRVPRLRAAAWTYLAAAAAVGVVISVRDVLPAGDNPARSLIVACAALVPLVWLAALDHAAGSRPRIRGERLQLVCLGTAIFMWATYGVLAIVRLRAAGGLVASGGALAVGLGMSAVAHLIAGAVLFVALVAIRASAGALPNADVWEYWMRRLLWAAGAAVVLQRVVFTPVAVSGAASWLLAVALGAALVLTVSGIARLHGDSAPSRAAAAVTLAALPPAAYAALALVTTFDWGFMLQKLSALAVGVTAFAATRALVRLRDASRPAGRQVALPVAAMVAFATSTVAAPRLSAWTHDPRLDSTFALDAYSAGDPSFRLLRQFLDRNQTLQRDAAFYSYLRANTSIAAEIAPVSIDFVPRIEPPAGRPPDIFLFVIDSLRRDYVAPYNPALSFTPSIAAFARDSVVFDRAFTRYGGTGLAVPSIWAGAMLIHKQYVTPFAPTNALAKLIDGEGYRRAVSFDHITDELFGFPDDGTALDRSVPEMTHTFCGTVDQLRTDIEAHSSDDRPLFAHTRALDLHIGNTRLATVPAGEAYPGFFGPYAARVRRIDRCFGEFVDFLKRTDRYERSIIVLLSDHGDSLGEGLRWGHGYTVFPEVIRIPLMIHLPRSMRARFSADSERVSFATDVTPTLYALLGQHPVRPRSEAGEPLFADAAHPLADRATESFLVASSYGAVYGLVSRNGQRLYIADAIEGHDYLYDMTADGDVRVGLTDAERESNRARIREQVADLAAWYGRR